MSFPVVYTSDRMKSLKAGNDTGHFIGLASKTNRVEQEVWDNSQSTRMTLRFD